MISAVCWVPKGASKAVPVAADPLSKAEIEEVLRMEASEQRGYIDEEKENENMDVDEAIHALAAAKALNQTRVRDFGGVQAGVDGLEELNMDAYDDEDDGVEIFGSGLGDSYYPSNDMDPYLLNKNDEGDDDDEIDDMIIKSTDSVIVCARNEDEVGHLEVWIFDDHEDGDSSMYVHHDIILPAFPLCTAWLDCNFNGGDKGNFLAVGSMEPAIEIWDLDHIDEVQPFLALGGMSHKKKGKKTSMVHRKDSHRKAVLDLAWNKEVRNVIASASADKSVKIWDVVIGKCVATATHHENEVYSVAWNRQSPELLISGSFDKSVIMVDGRTINKVNNKWHVKAVVESLAWDPHSHHSFVVSQKEGVVQGFDIRAASSDASYSGKPVFTLHAHDKTVSSVSYNPSTPNLLATGSEDKMVKLWDLSNNHPCCVASRNPNAGKIFSIAFSEDNPFLLAVGGRKGNLKVWDTAAEQGIASLFEKHMKLVKHPVAAA